MNKKNVVTKANIEKVADFLEESCEYFKNQGDGCCGIDDEPELADNYNFEIENGSYERKELNVYDAHDGYLLNSTVYEIVEVEF